MNDEYNDEVQKNIVKEENQRQEQIARRNEQKQKIQKEQKDLDKSTAAADAAAKVATSVFAGEAGTKVYDAVKQTNVGKVIVQTAGKVVNEAQKSNPFLKQAVNVASTANKVINSGNEVKAEKITEPEEVEGEGSNQNYQSNDENQISSDNQDRMVVEHVDGAEKKKDNILTKTVNLIMKIPKLVLILVAINTFFLLFSVMFVVFFADGLLGDDLGLTNWNYGSSGSSENIESDSNYSNENSSTISNNNLFSLIGENGINSLTEKINSVGANCTGNGIASKVVALIDGLNGYGYKIPYSNNNNDNSIINQNWGVDSSGNSQGFNDVSFIKWALTAGNVKTSVTKISDYKNLTKKIDLEYSKPGDLIIYGENVYMILQNIGSSVTIAHVTSDGLTYKKYSYDDVKNYDIYDMNLYYSSNCNN